MTTCSVLPSVPYDAVGPPNSIFLSRLNTQPTRCPVNASPLPSRTATHDSGPTWFATPWLGGTCTRETYRFVPAHREVKILMRLPDGRNVVTRQAVHGSVPCARTEVTGRWLGTAADSPCLDDSSRDDSARQHSAHNREFLELHYPWHPLHGRGILVRGRRKWGKHTAVRFKVEDEPQRVWTELPVWMFDRAVCSRMRLTDRPRVHWKALVELRQLLDETVCAPPLARVQDQHRCSNVEGGADEGDTSISSSGATSVFRSKQSSPPVEQSSGRRQASGNSIDGGDAP